MSEINLIQPLETSKLALETLIKNSSNPRLSQEQLSVAELEKLSFNLQEYGDFRPVSVFHYLFYMGQIQLFNYLIEEYHLQDLKQSQLVGPPLILIVIRLYLDPERFIQFYHLNHQIIFDQEHRQEFYWLFIQNLLQLGWYALPNQYHLVEICLEIALTKVCLIYTIPSQSSAEQTQVQLIKLYQALYQTGFQIGIKSFFKNYKLMRLAIQTMPAIYQYIQAHYSATLIQAIYRGYRTRRSIANQLNKTQNKIKLN